MSISPVHRTAPAVVILHSGSLPPGLDPALVKAAVRYAMVAELASAPPGGDVLLVGNFTSEAVRHTWSAADVMRRVHTASAEVDRVAFSELPSSTDTGGSAAVRTGSTP